MKQCTGSKEKGFYLRLFCFLLIILVLPGCGTASPEQTGRQDDPGKRTITDGAGHQVEIPAQINRVADAWGAHNEVMAAIGAGGMIVATTLTPEVRPWLYTVNPQLKHAATVFNIDASETNKEELFKAKPDVVFMNINEANAKNISDLGLPVIQLKITDFKSLEACIRLTGNILGGAAPQNAEKYLAYLNGKIKSITDITAALPAEQKPKVLHLASFSPLTVDGRDTIVDAAIEIAGGVNVADISGNNKPASMEQILKWNPDIIIIGRVLSGNGLNHNAQISRSNVDDMLQDPKWQQVKAVQDKKVYVNPDGAFSWDRYSAEEALQIQWLATVLHPDQFAGLDMVKETRYFFATFMKYDLSEQEVGRMLAGEPPPP